MKSKAKTVKKPQAYWAARIGILNPYGSIWSINTFESHEAAQQYLNDFWGRNKTIDLDKFKTIPVRVTVEAH